MRSLTVAMPSKTPRGEPLGAVYRMSSKAASMLAALGGNVDRSNAR